MYLRPIKNRYEISQRFLSISFISILKINQGYNIDLIPARGLKNLTHIA